MWNLKGFFLKVPNVLRIYYELMLEHLNFRELLQRWLLLQQFLLEYFTLAVSQIFAMLMPNKWYPISTTDAVVLTHNWYVYIQGSLEFCNSYTLFTRNTTDGRIQRDLHIADATTLLVLWVWREEITMRDGQKQWRPQIFQGNGKYGETAQQ